jgi:two-component sensor histidine kinase
LKESANGNLLREVLSRGFQSRSLAVIYAVNLYATGYLFPTEVILPGVDSHSWDLLVGLGGAVSLLLARWYFRSKTVTLYSWAQIAFSFSLVFFGATATGVAGSVLLFGANIPQSSIQGVFVFGPLGTLGQISIFSLITGAFIYSSRTSKSLAQERIALSLIQEKLREELESNKATLLLQISNALQPSLKSIEDQVAEGVRNPALVKQINMAINGVIRPLSQKLDEQTPLFDLGDIDRTKLARKIRRIPLKGRLSRTAPLNLALNPVVSIGTYFGFGLVSLLYLFLWSAAVQIFLPFLILSYLLFKLLSKPLSRIKGKIYVIFLASLLFANIQSIHFYFIGTIEGYDPELIGTIAFSIFTLTLGSSIFQIILNSIQANLKNAELVNIEVAQSISSVRQQLWRTRKNLSRGLHGGLQAKLQILALQIQKGIQVSPQSLIDVQSALLSAPDTQQGIQVSIIDFLGEQKEFWGGVCEIDFKISPTTAERLDSLAVINECIREVIREAINNAIKHAKSSGIEIQINLSTDSTFQLTVINSVHQHATSSNGTSLGSKLFDELSNSWNIEYNAGSTEFRASFKFKELFS